MNETRRTARLRKLLARGPSPWVCLELLFWSILIIPEYLWALWRAHRDQARAARGLARMQAQNRAEARDRVLHPERYRCR